MTGPTMDAEKTYTIQLDGLDIATVVACLQRVASQARADGEHRAFEEATEIGWKIMMQVDPEGLAAVERATTGD